MQTWTERPAEQDVEAVVRRYFGLLRAGRLPEAVQLVDHHPVRHVLKALWTASVGAGSDGTEQGGGCTAEALEQDLRWLGELDLADFRWGHTGDTFQVDVTHRTRLTELALGFWLRPTEDGLVLTGPATYW
ncbi:hypothetical protein ACIRBX_35360 [Kitasatospora sp. NPDC096147]|uniref:hypothetical protein n=1 Tax=Kitasatospora sp. NPDC096147 TaxID=3364093 RepID=UPI003827550D